MEQLELKVKGMSCMNCVGKIDKGLKEREGISEVKIDLPNNMVFVSFDRTKVSKEEIAENIKTLGYQPVLDSDTPEKKKSFFSFFRK